MLWRSIGFGFIIGLCGGTIVVLTVAACDRAEHNRSVPSPSVVGTGALDSVLLTKWGDLKQGISVIRDEKNGNLVYVGAVEWIGKSYAVAVTVVPIREPLPVMPGK